MVWLCGEWCGCVVSSVVRWYGVVVWYSVVVSYGVVVWYGMVVLYGVVVWYGVCCGFLYFVMLWCGFV